MAVVLAICGIARIVVAPSRGLRAEYFAGATPDGSPDLFVVDAAPTTVTVAQRWAGAAPSRFVVRWSGFITVPRSGVYTFTLTSDDGSTMSIDGATVIEHGGVHGATPKSGTVSLREGGHPVVVELTQNGGGFAIDWEWARGSAKPSMVPAWVLTPSPATRAAVIAGHVADLGFLACAIALGLLAVVALVSGRWQPARHPRLVAFALFLALACLHTWPIVTDPGHLTRHDNRDMILNEWIIAWVSHAAVHSPLHLFDGNIFYPEVRTLAYSEPMIVQAAMGAPLLWLGVSPVFTYNVLLILGFALSGWAMAVLVQRWTGDWTAGLVSGCSVGFCAHMITRLPHLQTQHVEFLPMALLALDTLLRQPAPTRGIKVAAWCVLQGLTSIYLLAITIFTMAAALLVRPADWLRPSTRPALKALGLGAVVALVLLVPFLLPYYRVSHDLGLSRSLGDAANYSANWNDYLTTPSRLHSALWSTSFTGTTGLFPGALALVLAIVAIVRGVAFKDPRARMLLAVAVAGVYLSFGPKMPGYAALYSALPLLQAIRATARFGYMATVGVGALAGFGVVIVRGWMPSSAWRVAAVVLVAAAALEPMAAPLGLARFDGIAPVYDRIPRRPDTVVVELPFPGPRSAQFHAHAMLNSTRNWQPIVNGYSGFQPASFYQHAEALQQFPDEPAFAMLHSIGVTHVVVHEGQYPPDILARIAARADLARVDRFGETVVYALRR